MKRCTILRLFAALCFWYSFTLVGCTKQTHVGSACPDAGCPRVTSCNAAAQRLPDECGDDDAGTLTCHDAPIADDRTACLDCNRSNQRLHVDATPIATCACAHCAAQVAACFESSLREADGNDSRDTACRKIVECGWANHCAGSDCYCGIGVGGQTCLERANTGHLPKGPCADLITTLSGCGDVAAPGNCVLNQQQTADTVLARATAVALCVTGDPLYNTTQPPLCPLNMFGDL